MSITTKIDSTSDYSLRTKLILVRHPQTVWNKEGKLQGRLNSEFTNLGNKQLEALTNRLKNVKIDLIYSSSAVRCILTAEKLKIFLNAKIIISDKLKELDKGEWEGKSWEEIKKEFPKEYAEWHDEKNVKPPQGENYQDLEKRVIPFLEEMVQSNLGRKILIITHGGVIKSIFGHYLRADYNLLKNLNQANCAINIIEFIEGNVRICKYNDDCHLKEIEK